uniref:Uncharacterized protein n=1 Tax=Arundo donax TaxID=35708 RepID=A0A0A9FEY1_ARUDO
MIRSIASFTWQKQELDPLILKIDPFFILIIIPDMMQPCHRVIFLDQAKVPSFIERPEHPDPLFYNAKWIHITRADFIKMTTWTTFPEWNFTVALPQQPRRTSYILDFFA